MPLPTDPLLAQQWHLIQTTAGLYDLNVRRVWDNYTGAGIDTFVLDDGFDYTHPDLAPNYSQTLDFDYADNDSDPFGLSSDAHGTAVSGIIGADNNGTGAVGVAFDTQLVGYRMAGTISNAFLEDVRDGIRDAANNGAEVMNISLGIANAASTKFGAGLSASLFTEIEASITTAVSSGRGGLGTIISKSAGNSRSSGYDANVDPWTNDTRQVVVAAVDQDGTVSSYSSYGAVNLISAFGTPGEVVTTDRVGAAGYDPGDFTATFNGTSSAAPMVAGVTALVLDANNNIGWRDVQDIYAYSARHVGSVIDGVTTDGIEREAWEWNGATDWNGGALHFSNDYGYGLIDALAAVRMAETWLIGRTAETSANELSTVEDGLNTPTAIADGVVAGTTFNIAESQTIEVERVTLTVTFSTTFIGDLEIYLISPDGTRSELVRDLGTGTFGDAADFNGTYTFESQEFRGERSNGTWQVVIADDAAGDTLTVSDIVLRTYGSAISNNDRYVFTNEYSDYAGLAGHSNMITDSDGGSDTVNAAAVTLASTINLNDGAVSTIDGVNLTMTGMESAIGGDGADVLTGRSTGFSRLYGMRGYDHYYVASSDTIVDESIAGSNGLDTVFGSISIDLSNSSRFIGDIERVTLVTGISGLNATGNDLANLLTGNNVGNTLDGRGGADTMRGLGGTDTYRVDNAGDIVDESVSGSGGTDTVIGRISINLSDTTHFRGQIERASLVNDITGLNLTGNSLANLLTGNNLGNTLDGKGGADTMRGMDGFDTYLVDNAGDIVDESVAGSGGTDTVVGRISIDLSDTAHFKGAIERASLVDGITGLNLTGNSLANLLTGNNLGNTLDGKGGADTMRGLGGTDTYRVDNTGDIVDESVAGSGGTDTVVGRISINLGDTAHFKGDIERASLVDGISGLNVTGNSLANILTGNNLGNRLNGKAGNDTLTGGGGTDKFVFDTALNASTNLDTITDFNVSDDTIHLDRSVFTLLTTLGTLSSTQFKNTASGAIDGSDRIIYNSSTGALIYDTNGSASGGATQFAKLAAGLSLTHNDFLIIA